MVDDILSSIQSAKTSDFIYSSLSFMRRVYSGPLPGSWFVEALAPLGLTESAVRQTLYRMERSGALLTERSGRTKLYGPSATSRAVMNTARARMRREPEATWDGAWTIVHFRFPGEESQARDRLREVLMVEGFGTLDPGLYLHPADRIARTAAAARELGVQDHMVVFRGPQHPRGQERRLVHELWDLAALRSRYAAFLGRFSGVRADRLNPQQAFGVRFAAMFEFFRITWDDPDLPLDLLADDWPGEQARLFHLDLVEALRQPAMAYAVSVREKVMTARCT
jgi:phenylacetic acid degradation operon negative regulatory protein